MSVLPVALPDYAEPGSARRWPPALANMHYLIGYDAWSFYVPQSLYVPADGDVALFARETDAADAPRICSLSPGRLTGNA